MSKIIRGGPGAASDRYYFDFKACRAADGWVQLDSKHDASYYGQWVNPLTLKLFSYCEGDTALTECEDEADFVKALRECIEWNKQAGYFLGLDAYGQDAERVALERMGFGAELH